MKTCIWCRKGELRATFKNKAHTIPQAIGGNLICTNVCDECNSFFGNRQAGYPSVEAVLKDTFGISRAFFLKDRVNEIPGNSIKRHKDLLQFRTSYFTVDISTNTVRLKQSYSVNIGFQEKLCKQLKKGIYKMFLEEQERKHGNALDDRFNFIRHFARYGLGNPPIIYFERGVAIIAISIPLVVNPEFIEMQYCIQHPHIYEFEFLGHVFGVASSSAWNIDFDNYIKQSIAAKTQFFRGWKVIQKFNDIDLTLSVFDDGKKAG
jgi:hypothetical protein